MFRDEYQHLMTDLPAARFDWSLTEKKGRFWVWCGALDRASPNFMGLARFGLEIGIFCDFLCSVILLNAIFGLDFLRQSLFRLQVWRFMTQFHHCMSIEFLPVYTPSPQEIRNPVEFAENVRQRMVTRLGVVATEHALADFFLLKDAMKLRLPASTTNSLPVGKLERLLELKSADLAYFLKRFAEYDTDKDGRIGRADFLTAMASGPAEEEWCTGLFEMFDQTQTGSLSYHEFIAALLYCLGPPEAFKHP
jgi:hypothetical protein